MQTSRTRHPTRRFLFSTTAGYGHFHPLVPLALALKQAGHEVAFAVRPSLLPLVEASGFTVFPVGGDLAADPEYQQVKAQLRTMPSGLEAELFSYPRLFGGIPSRIRTPHLVAIAQEWQPDMLIREAAEYPSLIAAEYLGLPHATVSIAAALRGMVIFEREVAAHLDPVRHTWGLAPDPDLKAPYRYLHLAYSPPTFSLQDVGYVDTQTIPRPIPPTTHFIRPDLFDQAGSESLPDWVERLPATAQPIIYVTLGTEANNEPGMYPRVLQTIIAGLRDHPANLIVTLGRDKDPADFGPQPPNVYIERYIPQSLLLPRCDLIVMHGGSNTLLASLDVGLPMVVVPLIADQFFNAQIAQSLRLGQVVPLSQLTPDRIGAAAQEVLSNPIYRQNTTRLQAEMQALPGINYAVELVERVAAEHKPVLNTNLPVLPDARP
jgi:UDP:flavonoid glycosyltransferase YjiC (YdhE family)